MNHFKRGDLRRELFSPHRERPGVGGLVTGEELQDLGQGAEELEHALLEGGAVVFLLLLHEVAHDALGLAEVLHGELSVAF